MVLLLLGLLCGQVRFGGDEGAGFWLRGVDGFDGFDGFDFGGFDRRVTGSDDWDSIFDGRNLHGGGRIFDGRNLDGRGYILDGRNLHGGGGGIFDGRNLDGGGYIFDRCRFDQLDFAGRGFDRRGCRLSR
jgi:hypothetical protein